MVERRPGDGKLLGGGEAKRYFTVYREKGEDKFQRQQI